MDKEIKINSKGIKLQPSVKEEEIKQISAKLHPEKDLDLIREIRKIPKRDRSRTYREALRNFLKGQA